jgi:hypothetical protein
MTDAPAAGPIDAATVADAAAVLHRDSMRHAGEVVATAAACDLEPAAANYAECFVRDFAETAAAWLQRGESAAVAAFVRTLAEVQARAAGTFGARAGGLHRERVERVRRLPVEEFGPTPGNPWNLSQETIPSWAMAWLRERGGYFAGNLGLARQDVRFFALGNLLTVSNGLATPLQADALFSLLEDHQQDLVGPTGTKRMYPALEGRDWATLTGSDRKNRAPSVAEDPFAFEPNEELDAVIGAGPEGSA